MPSLINKDDKRYELTIKFSINTNLSNINGNTTIHGGIPSGNSSITLKEGNTIESNGSKDVVIEKGILSLVK